MLAEITDVTTEEERKEPGGMQSVLRKHARGEKTTIVHRPAGAGRKKSDSISQSIINGSLPNFRQ